MSESTPQQLAEEASALAEWLGDALHDSSGASFEAACLACAGQARTMEAVLREDPKRWARYQLALAILHDIISTALRSENVSEKGGS